MSARGVGGPTYPWGKEPPTLDLAVMTTVLESLWTAEALAKAAGRNDQMMYMVRGLQPIPLDATLAEREAVGFRPSREAVDDR